MLWTAGVYIGVNNECCCFLPPHVSLIYYLYRIFEIYQYVNLRIHLRYWYKPNCASSRPCHEEVKGKEASYCSLPL